MFARLVEEAQLRGRVVIEVGSGSGRLAQALSDKYGCSVVATDASPEMLAVGRSRTLEIRFEQARAERLPFEAQTFERVVTHMAVHLFDRPRAFREFHRVLTPDGTTAISTPDPDSFPDSVWSTYFPSDAEIDRARFPSARQLMQGLDDAGFDSVRLVHLYQQGSISREDALLKMRERAFSTFDSISNDEFARGLRRAEDTMPQRVAYPIRWLIALGAKTRDAHESRH